MKRIFLIIVFIFSTNILFAQYYMVVNKADGTKTITAVGDIEDITFMEIDCGTATVLYSGKTYNTVLIGTQCWLKENLDVGAMIGGSQNQTDNAVIEKYCYGSDPANCTTYGGLYQWDEAMQYSTTPGVQGIYPPGWHIPTFAEFQTLYSTVGGDGNALKAIGQGTSGGAGTNTSGFSALLAGFRHDSGYFFNLGTNTFFWSSTAELSSSFADYLKLYFDESNISLNFDINAKGVSVRCIKD